VAEEVSELEAMEDAMAEEKEKTLKH